MDSLIARNLVCQKKDIATYAREQNAELVAQSTTHRPSRGRGSRGGRAGRQVRVSPLIGEREWDEDDRPATKRRIRRLGDSLELSGKKVKMEYNWDIGVMDRSVPKEEFSAVDSERRTMLFSLNIERYTCILRQQLILHFVEERVGSPRPLDPS